jgi:hypothetical protein
MSAVRLIINIKYNLHNLFAIKYSAIWMVFVAAPFRKLCYNPHIQGVFLTGLQFYLQNGILSFCVQRLDTYTCLYCLELQLHRYDAKYFSSFTSKSFVNSTFTASLCAYYWYSNRSGRNSNGIIPNIFLVSRTNFISSLVYPLSSKDRIGIAFAWIGTYRPFPEHLHIHFRVVVLLRLFQWWSWYREHVWCCIFCRARTKTIWMVEQFGLAMIYLLLLIRLHWFLEQ